MIKILDFVKSTKVYLENLTDFRKIDMSVEMTGEYSQRDMLYSGLLIRANDLLENCDSEHDVIANIYYTVNEYIGRLTSVVESVDEITPSVAAHIIAYTVAILSSDYFLTVEYDTQKELMYATRVADTVDFLLKGSLGYICSGCSEAQAYLTNVINTYVPFLKATTFISEESDGLRVRLPQKMQEAL